MTLEERIHREIPISAHMQVRVLSSSREHVEVAVPLAPNINHEGTAFGGSVSSLALLSCWSLVNVVLADGPDLKFDYVVVQDTAMDYVTPIDSDFSAVSSFTSSVDRFLTTLKKHGRARISLSADVLCGGRICATLTARFVAQVARS